MIRVLANGYSGGDYKFLRNFFEFNITEIVDRCSSGGTSCVKCGHRRACLDILEVSEFLGKEVDENGKGR